MAVADVFLRKLENAGALVVLFEDGREIECSWFTAYRFAATAAVAD